MLAGAIAHDVTLGSRTPARASARLVVIGLVVMGLGYGLSCLSRLYDDEPPIGPSRVAASPVWPPFANASGRPWRSLLAEPPLVQPSTRRPFNYWMMNKKRVTSLPFTLFAMGWAATLCGMFVLACDSGGLTLGVFQTFGQNALAAYVIHHLVEEQVHHLIPRDAPLAACLAGLMVFLAITYLIVRYLETQKISIHL